MTPSNAASLSHYFTGFKTAFEGGFSSAENPDLWQRIALRVPSSAREEIYRWLGEYPEMREWLGDRIVKELDASEFRIKNRKWEVTIEVDEDDAEDSQLASLVPRLEGIGETAALLPNRIVFDVLNNGKTLLGYDGLPLFSTSHPATDGGIDSNYETGASEPWILMDNSHRVRRPVIYQPRRAPRFVRMDRPNDYPVFWKGKAIYGADRRDGAGPGFWQTVFLSELALNATSFDDAIAQMSVIENSEGRSMGITPKLLITTPANRAAAKALLNAERLASGASNTNFQAVDVLITDQMNIV